MGAYKVLPDYVSESRLFPRQVFVFGGNAVGNGTADSEVANLLLVLKLRHPDRVSSTRTLAVSEEIDGAPSC